MRDPCDARRGASVPPRCVATHSAQVADRFMGVVKSVDPSIWKTSAVPMGSSVVGAFQLKISVDQDLSVIVAVTINDDDVKQRLVPIVFTRA